MLVLLIIGVVLWIVQATLVTKAALHYAGEGRYEGISFTPGWAAILFLSIYFILI